VSAWRTVDCSPVAATRRPSSPRRPVPYCQPRCSLRRCRSHRRTKPSATCASATHHGSVHNARTWGHGNDLDELVKAGCIGASLWASMAAGEAAELEVRDLNTSGTQLAWRLGAAKTGVHVALCASPRPIQRRYYDMREAGGGARRPGHIVALSRSRRAGPRPG